MTKMFRISTINGRYYVQEGYSVGPPPGETGAWVLYKDGNWITVKGFGWFYNQQDAMDDVLMGLETNFKARKVELMKARILKQGQN